MITVKDAKGKYIHIRIDTTLKDEFVKLTKEKAINPSELIRNYIEKWVQDNKKK